MHEPTHIDTAGALTPPAELEVRDGVPWSARHDDVYHHADGMGERQHVFLGLNALPERFAALRRGTQFHLGELGFGSGLTVMLASRLFLRTAPVDCSLHVTSMEAAPLRPHEWASLTPLRAHLTEIADLHACLAGHAPPPLRGWHRRWLHPRIRLSLFHGEARDGLDELRAHGCGAVDAWCLDGFAPDRNADMWDDGICAALAALSAPGTTLATFTTQAGVREGLTRAGFAVERVDGRPHKRRHLRGHWAGEGPGRARLRPPPPAHIVGAGIAGSALAHALASRGGSATLADRHPDAPGGASANPATALQVRLPRRLDALGQLRLMGFATSAAWLAVAGPDGWMPGGLLHLGLGRDAAWLESFAAYFPGIAEALDATAAGEIGGCTGVPAGVLLPASGRADLPRLCRGLWPQPPHVAAAAGATTPAATVGTRTVLASPEAVPGFGLRGVPGTVTLFQGAPPRLPLSGDGYVLPLGNGLLAAGGTYDREGDEDADDRNAARVRAHGLAAITGVRGRFQGVRHTPPDRLPLVGPTGDADTEPWLCTGFASSGLSWAWLAAEIIASEWCAEPPAVAPQLRARLLPSRIALPRR